MRFSVIIFMLAVFGISSCYDDKGNYNYKDLASIEIGPFSASGRIYLTIGDTLRIDPQFTYSSKDTVMNLEYTWTFAGEVIGKGRHLECVMDTIADAICFLKVEDVEHGVHFIQSVSVDVSYKYQTNGFLVLSEKDGKACLSFLKQGSSRYDAASELDSIGFTVIENVYRLENQEEFQGKPVKVHEHFCADSDTKGQTLVVLDNGLVDVNSLTFQKEVTGDQIFVGGWPDGMKPADVMFMQWVDLITDDKGQLYSRVKSTNQLFHSEYFLPEPMSFENEVMKQIEIVLARFSTPQYCLLYDGKHNRYLALLDMMDADEGVNEAGVVKNLDVSSTSGGYPDGFPPLENLGDYRPRYTGCVKWDWYNLSYFALLEKDGKFYHQEFTLKRDEASFTISGMKFTEIPGLDGIMDENSVVYALPYNEMGWYVLISKGNQLYLYDREAPVNGVKLFYTFDPGENVTCMDAEFYRSRCLGVGLSNGRVAVMKMKGAKNAQTDEEKIFWKSEPGINLGGVKSIRYKVQTGNGWT